VSFRLLTYNIRHGGRGREPALAEVIASCRPDLVVFQEATNETTIDRIASLCGMAQCGAQPKTSLGFMSRRPVTAHTWHRPRLSRHAFLEIHPSGVDFPVFGVHLSAVHAAWTERRRMIELGALLRTIRQHDRGFHLLAGDFNTLAPGDVFDFRKLPARLRALVWLSGGRIRWRTIEMVLNAGYVDAFRKLHPDDRGPDLSGLGSSRSPRLPLRIGRTCGPAADERGRPPPTGESAVRSLSPARRDRLNRSDRPNGPGSIITVLPIAITRRMMSTTASTFPPQPATDHDRRSAGRRPGPRRRFGGVRRVPEPVNDPNRSYAPGSPERAELKARLKAMAGERLDIPIVIGGKDIRTGRTAQAVMPHDHSHVLADYHLADAEHVQQAIAASAAARREWASWPWEDRAAVILRGAELLATSWRSTIVAATMLGQSKTVFQAEIDAASEMIDFWRFNTYFAQELYNEQPVSSPGMWNQMEYRGLEGFVYAISPFNFTAIGGNLTTRRR
jgi:hypothetical protein